MMKFKMNLRSFRALVAIVASLFAIFTVFGQGCGEAPQVVSGSSLGLDVCSGGASNVIDKNFEVIPGTPTVSISYGRQLLDSFVSCTGIGAPSQRTLDEWTSRNQSLSEYGSLTDVSGAMMMAVAAVAAETCRDLVDKELAQAPLERIIFGNVNLDGNGLSASEILDTAQMLALACWQRPYNVDEQAIITQIVGQMNTSSENQALGLCTAMLSTLAGIQL